MTPYEKIGGVLHESRQALDDAHQAEEEARRAFERSTPARARILAAQADGRLPEMANLSLLEAYYRQAEVAMSKGLRFVEVSRQGKTLIQTTVSTSSASPKVKKESIEVMKVALRVLTAVTEKSMPAAADRESLLSFAPDLTALPPDELACEVVQRAMKRQVHMQRAMTGSY